MLASSASTDNINQTHFDGLKAKKGNIANNLHHLKMNFSFIMVICHVLCDSDSKHFLML